MLTHAEVRQEVRQRLIQACKTYCSQPIRLNRPDVLRHMGALDVLNTPDARSHWQEYAEHLALHEEQDWAEQIITVSEWSKACES